MDILNILESYSESDRYCIQSGSELLTYQELWELSTKLACYIETECAGDYRPVIVYGHKHPLMLVAFVACMKSGRAYVPIDINVPESRIQSIVEKVSPRLILSTEHIPLEKKYQGGGIKFN